MGGQDSSRVDDVHEELNEFDADLAMQRENRRLRAARIVATVEMSVYDEVAKHLRAEGLDALATLARDRARAANAGTVFES